MRTTVLVIIATLPLAYLGAWAEQLYRKRQNASYNQLLTWNRKGNTNIFAPHRLTVRALVELFLLNFSLFWLCLLPLLIGLKTVQPWVAGGPQPTWSLLWIAACAGAILALRVRKAYALAAVSVLLAVLSGL
jgi:PTS system mannose-specific IIC component